MTEEQRTEIKKALIKCAEENEGKNTFTGYVIVSSVCKAGAERIAELEKENAELKDYRLTTLAKQQTEMSKYALNLEHKLSWYDNQLTKAKEIIKKFSEFAKNEIEYDPEHPQEHTDLWNKLCAEAEQFLKGE